MYNGELIKTIDIKAIPIKEKIIIFLF